MAFRPKIASWADVPKSGRNWAALWEQFVKWRKNLGFNALKFLPDFILKMVNCIFLIKINYLILVLQKFVFARPNQDTLQISSRELLGKAQMLRFFQESQKGTLVRPVNVHFRLGFPFRRASSRLGLIKADHLLNGLISTLPFLAMK